MQLTSGANTNKKNDENKQVKEANKQTNQKLFTQMLNGPYNYWFKKRPKKLLTYVTPKK